MLNYLLLIITGGALIIAGHSLRRLHITSAIHLAVLAFAVSLWSLIGLLFELKTFNIPDLVFVSASYLLSTIAASALLTFSLAYSDRSSWMKRNLIILLMIEPLITQVLLWFEPARELFFLENGTSPASISLYSGLWSDINALYLYNFEIAGLLLLTDVFIKKRSAFGIAVVVGLR